MEALNEIWIGNDHGGYQMKKHIIEYLKDKQIAFRDIGSDSVEIVRYPYFAARIAKAVSVGTISRGILICSTGIGMSIIANKFKGVYAVHCTNSLEAKRSVAINNANMLVLAEWLTPGQHGIEIADSWLNASFGEGFDPDWKEFLKKCYTEIQDMEEEQFKCV